MQTFIKMSRYAGMREDLVQAGGGNSSVKVSETRMIIKASGYQLADITEERGVAVVNPDIIRKSFQNPDFLYKMTEKEGAALLRKAFVEGEKPSIETFLHAFLNRYTLHTHPVVVNALTCRENGMSVLQELFPGALTILYATPGAELAKTYFEAYQKIAQNTDSACEVIFMQNHGLLVSGSTADTVIRKTEEIVRTIEQYLDCNMEAYHTVTELWTYFPEKIIWRVTDQHIYAAYESFGGIWKHTFCPDCVVFLGRNILNSEYENLAAALKSFIADYGRPAVIRLGEEFYLVADSVQKAMELQSILSFSAQVMMLNQGQACRFLPDEEQKYLLGWEAEKYRKQR